MTATEILGELTCRGVSLEVVGDRLLFRPQEAVPAELVEALREHKAEILAALPTEQQATGYSQCPGPEKCAGCYPIHGGRYLHPPKPSQSWRAWLRKWQPEGDERLQ